MKSSTILVVSDLLSLKHDQLDSEFKEKVLEVILMVLKEKNRETFNSIVTFLKLYTKIADINSFKMQLKYVLKAIYEWDPENAKNSSKIMTNLLEKIMKKLVAYQ
jgi:hypothetical protein